MVLLRSPRCTPKRQRRESSPVASSILVSFVFVGQAIALDTTSLLDKCTSGGEAFDKELQLYFKTYCTCLVDSASASEIKTLSEWEVSDEAKTAVKTCIDRADKKK